ncbi:unnamed protein product, partial [Symbiodinium sp. KB8]
EGARWRRSLSKLVQARAATRSKRMSPTDTGAGPRHFAAAGSCACWRFSRCGGSARSAPSSPGKPA